MTCDVIQYPMSQSVGRGLLQSLSDFLSVHLYVCMYVHMVRIIRYIHQQGSVLDASAFIYYSAYGLNFQHHGFVYKSCTLL